MNVFQSWAKSRHLENVSIETIPPEELDMVLTKFYAEVKKGDGDDYEPESLKIMQSAIERHLKDKNYPLSIVRSRSSITNKSSTRRHFLCASKERVRDQTKHSH